MDSHLPHGFTCGCCQWHRVMSSGRVQQYWGVTLHFAECLMALQRLVRLVTLQATLLTRGECMQQPLDDCCM